MFEEWGGSYISKKNMYRFHDAIDTYATQNREWP